MYLELRAIRVVVVCSTLEECIKTSSQCDVDCNHNAWHWPARRKKNVQSVIADLPMVSASIICLLDTMIKASCA